MEELMALLPTILAFLGGLCLFLFGMTLMGDSLEKSAGSQLKGLLARLTSTPIKGLILGAGVTAIIQSSSATTVMLVGFVNSGLMTLAGAIPVIMGANIGTTITAWLLSLTAIEAGGVGGIIDVILLLLKPTSFSPVLALAGVVMYVFLKDQKKKDMGLIFLGFATLIFGMNAMSDSVEFLKNEEWFTSLFTMFNESPWIPILGVIIGAVVTGIIQSSSASVGILQALANNNLITYSAAIPIIMGQNIGTCVTAMLASAGTNKNARRVSVVHLCFNIIGTVAVLAVFYGLNFFFKFPFLLENISAPMIATIHTVFNIVCTVLIMPFYKQLEKLAMLIVRDKPGEDEEIKLFDDLLLETPSVAIDRAKSVSMDMARSSVEAIKCAISTLEDYSPEKVKRVFELEGEGDMYEDQIANYIIKVTERDLNPQDNLEATKLLHMISDLERLSDHAVNIAQSAEEMHEKKLSFSKEAQDELAVMLSAVTEILEISLTGFVDNDVRKAQTVEPLEEVIDGLKDGIRLSHIRRLKKNECTIELGFILTDLLTDLERISDHCSNIAGCVVEIAHNSLGMHEYTHTLHEGDEEYDKLFELYSKKYNLLTPPEKTAYT